LFQMPDIGLRRKLAWLIAIRAVVSTILLGSATLAQFTAPGSFPIDPFFFLIGLTYALTIGYASTLRYVDRFRWLVDLQLAFDALIVSAFIDLTGGLASYFSVLYVLPIVAGGTVQFRRGGLLVAALSTVLYVGIVLQQYFDGLILLPAGWPPPPIFLPTRLVAANIVVLNVFGFCAVGFLSGSLAESLRSAGAKLRQASTEIADLQALNQHVITSLPSGLVTTDPKQRILTFNRAAESITGIPSSTALGRPVTEVLQLPPEIARRLDDNVPQTTAGRRGEFHFRTGDGRGEIELGLSATHLETPGGRAGFLLSFQDVTQIKKLQRDNTIQQRLAAVGEMAARIAHEIRNPLASMSGSIQILRQELPLSAEQEQLMDIVLRESERLNSTIRSFLAYARPQRFAITRFDVSRVLNDAAMLLRNGSDLDDRHLVEVDVPPEELWYEADESQIKQVVWNLATNGLRAMPDGGRLRLAGAVDASAGDVILTVQDEGIGIPPEDPDGLFHPFHGRISKGTAVSVRLPPLHPVGTS